VKIKYFIKKTIHRS